MADMTFNFNLKPNTTTLDLGDSTNKWQNLYVGTIAATTFKAPTSSNGTTLGAGSSGQFLCSNGTSNYWASLPTASTSAAGIIQIGTGATNACAGNDSRLSNSRTPTAHATTSTTYGGGTASNYGHVALTDTYATVSTSQKAANSIAASAWALQTAYTTLNSKFARVDKASSCTNRHAKVFAFALYKMGAVCYMSIEIWSPIDTNGTLMLTLPSDCRPAYRVGATVTCTLGAGAYYGGVAHCVFGTDGKVLSYAVKDCGGDSFATFDFCWIAAS